MSPLKKACLKAKELKPEAFDLRELTTDSVKNKINFRFYFID